MPSVVENNPTPKTVGLVASCLLLFVSLSIASSVAQADDWPHWRGVNRDDMSTESGLLKEWPKGGPKEAWLNKDSGLGYSGFAIVDGKLFTMGLEDEREFALCLNADTGKELWRSPIGERYQNGWGDGPRSTPSVDGDRVYCMSAKGSLVCLKTDGSSIWEVKMEDFGGSIPKWGYAESPLVDGDQVVCTPGGKQGTMLALNKMTGKKVWQTKPVSSEGKTAAAHYSSILPVDLNGRRQYIQLLVLAAIGVDAESGEVLWQSNWPGRIAVIPSPIYRDGEVFVTSGYSVGGKLIKVAEDNSVEDVWFTKTIQNHHGGVIQLGDYFYGSSGKKGFTCLNRADGEMVWNERKIKKGCVAYADGLFYYLQESDGKVLLIDADEEKPNVISQFTLSPQTKRRNARGKIWVHPVIANGKLYLRDQEIIYCFEISK